MRLFVRVSRCGQPACPGVPTDCTASTLVYRTVMQSNDQPNRELARGRILNHKPDNRDSFSYSHNPTHALAALELH